MSIKARKFTPRQYSEAEKEELREAFNSIDKDHNGRLDQEEIENFMVECNLEKEFAKLAMKLVDKDGDGKVSFDEFLVFIDLLQRVEEDPNILFVMLFQTLDTDNSGRLEANEIREFVSYFSTEPVTSADVDKFIAEFDTDNDGTLSLQEIIQILT
ncbi:Squidulin [Tritrichomonas foetus]|uniref:Squidulin n=1 Tax=Tritrichomonas foetus TaxID=1144522 RepID=A0A1J4JUN0_9EUKA|nr:Squidulin [Tritrichomonas foetus]|eukprot:OHT02707.1 Squidulin [Tritrichomonas foetus]